MFINFCRAFAFLTVSLSCSAQIAPRFELVALQDHPEPRIGPTATFGILGNSPHIDAGGRVAIGGFVNLDPTANYAVWSGFPGDVTPLAATGDPTPGRQGETLDVFALSSSAEYWPCPDGSVAFSCRTKPSNDTGIWHGTPGSLEAVVIVGDAAPGIPGATVIGSGPLFVANGDGAVLFSSAIDGIGTTDETDSAIWVKLPGQTATVVAREGDQAPGTSAGTTFDRVSSSALSMNAAGQVAFVVRVRSGDFDNNTALFSGTAGALLPIVRKGDPIPGMPGFVWDGLAHPVINQVGDVAFRADPDPDGPRSFFVRVSDGSVSSIAAEGEAAPGSGGDLWSDFFFNRPLIAGHFTAFMAGLNDATSNGRDGIWLHQRGAGTSLVARLGDPVPGFPGDTFSVLDPPIVNALGSVVFSASTTQGNRGFWHYRGGTLHLVVAVDQLLEVDENDIREVNSLFTRNECSSQNGYRSSLNDQGQFVFRASLAFPVGTAVFRVNLEDLDSGGTGYLLEEAFGGDPNDPTDDHTILPSASCEGGDLVMTYRRRTDGAYLYEVQSSTLLTADSWTAASGTITPAADQSGLPPGFERIEFRLPVVSGDRVFLRIEVSPS